MVTLRIVQISASMDSAAIASAYLHLICKAVLGTGNLLFV